MVNVNRTMRKKGETSINYAVSVKIVDTFYAYRESAFHTVCASESNDVEVYTKEIEGGENDGFRWKTLAAKRASEKKNGDEWSENIFVTMAHCVSRTNRNEDVWRIPRKEVHKWLTFLILIEIKTNTGQSGAQDFVRRHVPVAESSERNVSCFGCLPILCASHTHLIWQVSLLLRWWSFFRGRKKKKHKKPNQELVCRYKNMCAMLWMRFAATIFNFPRASTYSILNTICECGLNLELFRKKHWYFLVVKLRMVLARCTSGGSINGFSRAACTFDTLIPLFWPNY